MTITKVSVPFGVIGVIYEARPNVTADAAAICIKTGNTAVLRGGKEAFRSANAIVNAMRTANVSDQNILKVIYKKLRKKNK